MTADDRRLPHLVLGLARGADLADARRAHARRLRAARHDDRLRAELDWALEQMEAAAADPGIDLGRYRLPADPGALLPPDGYGLLRPAPRPVPRTTPPTTDDERAALYDVARTDAAHDLLDRTATSVGKRLDRVGESPIPTVTLARLPERRRSWWPVIAVAAACVLALAAASIARLVDDAADDESAVETTLPPAARTTTSPSSTTTSTTVPGLPGLGDTVTVGGTSITVDDALDVFDHLCLVFTIDGDGALGFVRSQLKIVSGGVSSEPALEIGTGRAPIEDVVGGDGPVEREACFALVGWQDRTTDLLYTSGADTFRWRIAGPSPGA